MSLDNGYSNSPDKYKVPSLYHLQEVDATRFPDSILKGFVPASTDDAALQADEIRPGNANEIWILQCPANVQLTSLIQGKKLFLDNRHQVIDQDDKCFEAICLPRGEGERAGEAALVPDESGKMQLVSFPVAGHIMIKAIAEEAPPIVPRPSPPKVHQLPKGLKIRHPIYGTDYESIIVDVPIPSKRKKKKEKPQEEEIEVVYYEVEPPRTKKEKLKKRKADEETVVEEESEAPRKKKKRHTEHAGFLEPEPIKNKMKMNVVKMESESESDVELLTVKRKKVKDQPPEDQQHDGKHKKKKKHLQETEEPEPKKKRKSGPSSSSYSE